MSRQFPLCGNRIVFVVFLGNQMCAEREVLNNFAVFLTEFTDMTGRTFDAVTTRIRPYRRRFSRSCKRISGVLLCLAPLHRGRANVSYQRGQNRSHAGWTRLHTRCGLEFLSQVSSNYSSLLKHFSANQN